MQKETISGCRFIQTIKSFLGGQKPGGLEPLAPITLKGKPGGEGNDERVTVLTKLLDIVFAKENHIDSLRQRNITIALAIFAGLFGFGLGSPEGTKACFASLGLSVLMLVFTILDRRLHMFSHGWRRTRWELTSRLSDVINDPSLDVSFLRYYSEAETTAEWHTLQPVIYYFLVLGGILSVFAFR